MILPPPVAVPPYLDSTTMGNRRDGPFSRWSSAGNSREGSMSRMHAAHCDPQGIATTACGTSHRQRTRFRLRVSHVVVAEAESISLIRSVYFFATFLTLVVRSSWASWARGSLGLGPGSRSPERRGEGTRPIRDSQIGTIGGHRGGRGSRPGGVRSLPPPRPPSPSGLVWNRSAASPAMCGVAIDDPDILAKPPPGTEEMTSTPGPIRSGTLGSSGLRNVWLDEKSATSS